jgi:hypothetical protein
MGLVSVFRESPGDKPSVFPCGYCDYFPKYGFLSRLVNSLFHSEDSPIWNTMPFKRINMPALKAKYLWLYGSLGGFIGSLLDMKHGSVRRSVNTSDIRAGEFTWHPLAILICLYLIIAFCYDNIPLFRRFINYCEHFGLEKHEHDGLP